MKAHGENIFAPDTFPSLPAFSGHHPVKPELSHGPLWYLQPTPDPLSGVFQGFIPGVWGVSHGALQFMVYEQLKTAYNRRRGQAIDAKLVSAAFIATRLW